MVGGTSWLRNLHNNRGFRTLGLPSPRRGDRRIFHYDRHAAVQSTTDRIVATIRVCVRRYRILFAKPFDRNVGRRSAAVFDEPLLYRLRALARELDVPGLCAFRIGIAFHRYVAFRKLRQYYCDFFERL